MSYEPPKELSHLPIGLQLEILATMGRLKCASKNGQTYVRFYGLSKTTRHLLEAAAIPLKYRFFWTTVYLPKHN